MRQLVYILVLLSLAACGSFKEGQSKVSSNSTNKSRSRMCTMVYSPVRCQADQFIDGSWLPQDIDVTGGNACDADYKFEDAAIAMGVDVTKVAKDCQAVAF